MSREDLLPLFPLGLVLLPRTPLGLHIFEDRYKDMIGNVLRTDGEFGVVLGEERGIANVGCTAIVEKVTHRYADGRMDIVTRGQRRFEIILLNEEKPYLRATVQFFDDEEAVQSSEDLRARVLESYRELRSADDAIEGEADLEDPQLSFQLLQFVRDANFRQQLLPIRSEAERLRQLAAFLPEYTARLVRVLHDKQVAPTNGHGTFPGPLDK